MTGGRLSPRHLSFETIDSTNREAERQHQAGEAGPLWITAARQVAGRGRSGREWISVTGNLYATFLFPFPGTIAEAPKLGFVAAVAVAEALHRLTPAADVQLKWPNDCLLNGRKVCGLLLENFGRSPGGGLAIAIGAGINLAAGPPASQTRWPPTSLLAETGLKVTPDDAVAALDTALEHWLGRFLREGFAPVRAAWKTRSAHLGQQIEVRGAHEAETGLFADLDAEGALLLETSAGVRRITAGDVTFGELVNASGD